MMTPGTRVQPVEILLVEDNPVDVMITKKAFSAGRVCNNLHVAEDGEEAMDFLHKRGKYSSAPSPGNHSSGFESAQKRWTGNLGGNQGRSVPAAHSCHHSHDFGRQRRYLAKLRSAGQLLYYQTG